MAADDPLHTPTDRRGGPLESYVRELIREAGWSARRSSQRRVRRSADGVRRIADVTLGARPGPDRRAPGRGA